MKKIKSVQYYELNNGQKFAIITKGSISTLINSKKEKLMEQKNDKINILIEYMEKIENENIKNNKNI